MAAWSWTFTLSLTFFISLAGCQSKQPLALPTPDQKNELPPPSPPDAPTPPDDPSPPEPVPPPDYALSCASGAFCFEKPGLFHAPVQGNDVKRFSVVPPVGIYKKVRLVFEVYLKGWRPGTEALRYNFFWLVRNINKDMIGYLNAMSPNNNTVFFRHGFNLTAEAKFKISKRKQLDTNTTYRIFYIYDLNAKTITTSIQSLGGQEILQLTHTPNISDLSIASKDKILIDFGFQEGVNPQEPASWGWEYSNLVLEMQK